MPRHTPKTNAARILDRLQLPYTLQSYEAGKDHASAEAVAQQVGMNPASVFKTLLAHGDRLGHCFAIIPAISELDLKALARASDNRKMNMVPLKQVQPLTGYVRGGVTALASKKALPVFLDASALQHPQIAVSAGHRGLQLLLAPADYAAATGATLARIAHRIP